MTRMSKRKSILCKNFFWDLQYEHESFQKLTFSTCAYQGVRNVTLRKVFVPTR